METEENQNPCNASRHTLIAYIISTNNISCNIDLSVAKRNMPHVLGDDFNLYQKMPRLLRN